MHSGESFDADDPECFTAIYDRYFTAVYRYVAGRLGPQIADDLAAETFVKGCLTSLLVDVPASPQTRAAAFRALADEPGVDTLGKVEDERGRQGVGIVLRQSGGHPEIKLVIDPETSVVLSQQIGKQPVLSKNVKALYLDVGWTDSAPQVPAVP